MGVELGWVVLGAVVAGLATARLTRLTTLDEITRELREAVLRRLDADNPYHLKLAYLMECGWCTSVWWGAALVGGTGLWWGAPWWWAALSVMALSQVTGMLGDLRFYLRHHRRSNEDE